VDAEDRACKYRRFVLEAEPKLRRALIAAYGPERGREATCEALAYAWQHWDRVEQMKNPVGYLYRVGQTRSIPRKVRPVFERPDGSEPLVEPALAAAVAELSERQRVAVLLVHAAGWTIAEVSDLLEINVSTVQRHVDRGLRKLRARIGGIYDGR
jgi:DNA-directed RNA polymerase specialized sigma24 family protein